MWYWCFHNEHFWSLFSFFKWVEALNVIFDIKETEKGLLVYVPKRWSTLLLDIEKIPCIKTLSKFGINRLSFSNLAIQWWWKLKKNINKFTCYCATSLKVLDIWRYCKKARRNLYNKEMAHFYVIKTVFKLKVLWGDHSRNTQSPN